MSSRVRNIISWMRGLDPVRVDVLLAGVFLVWFEVHAVTAAHPQTRLALATE